MKQIKNATPLMISKLQKCDYIYPISELGCIWKKPKDNKLEDIISEPSLDINDWELCLNSNDIDLNKFDILPAPNFQEMLQYKPNHIMAYMREFHFSLHYSCNNECVIAYREIGKDYNILISDVNINEITCLYNILLIIFTTELNNLVKNAINY